METHEDLPSALNLMQLAPDAGQPRTRPSQSGGLADGPATASREGDISPDGSDKGNLAAVAGGEATKGGKKKRKNHRGGKKNKKTDNTIPKALYELKYAAGKGFGVFASQDIKYGTRIMSEKPLLIVPPQMDVPTAFSELSRHDQGLFLSLHCRQYNAGDVNNLIELREKPIEGLDMGVFPVELQAKVIAIHGTNNVVAGDKTVVCAEFSRFNHSCVPNAHHQWNANIGAVTVHAVQDIAVGEEFLIPYIALCRDRATRTADLGFQCICAACDASTEFGKASEERRKSLALIECNLILQKQLIARGLNDDFMQGISTVRQSIKLLGEEGICGWEMARRFSCANPQI